MSEAELLLVGVTMILATGLVRCVDGIYHSMTSQRRYWMPQVLLWSTFIYGVNFLWAYKNNLSIDPTWMVYASSIAIASTFVLRGHILASSNPEQIEDWAKHFEKSARPYFIVAFLTSISSLVAAWAANDSTGYDAQSIPFWIGAGLNVIGAISGKVWVRGTVAVTHFILVILASYILFSNEMI
ncbi:MAG: hypothetical protein ABJK25_14470 [Halieaceae bacterium]